MIRKSTISLNSSNDGKLQQLDRVMTEAVRVLNVFIRVLWDAKQFHGKFAQLKTETWLSARMQGMMSCQALHVVKSQRLKRKKTMPVVTHRTLELDERFLAFCLDANSFDFWIRIGSLGERIIMNLPSLRHRHFNHFVEDGWTLKKSGRLRHTEKGWFLDVFFEKPEPLKSTAGKAIGVDCGYKKLLAASDGQTTGLDVEQCYEKIARKKRGSKAYTKALAERDNLIGVAVNSLDLQGVSTVVVEALHNVKKGSSGKIRKSFNNKLQYWSYRQCLSKLQSVCEINGTLFVTIDPAYTSQTCSSCGLVDKSSRRGEQFLCTGCGTETDADFNASVNILMRGTYSSPSKGAPGLRFTES